MFGGDGIGFVLRHGGNDPCCCCVVLGVTGGWLVLCHCGGDPCGVPVDGDDDGGRCGDLSRAGGACGGSLVRCGSSGGCTSTGFDFGGHSDAGGPCGDLNHSCGVDGICFSIHGDDCVALSPGGGTVGGGGAGIIF